MQLEHFRPLLQVYVNGEDKAVWANLKGSIVYSERTMQEVRFFTEWTLPALTNVSKAAVLHAMWKVRGFRLSGLQLRSDTVHVTATIRSSIRKNGRETRRVGRMAPTMSSGTPNHVGADIDDRHSAGGVCLCSFRSLTFCCAVSRELFSSPAWKFQCGADFGDRDPPSRLDFFSLCIAGFEQCFAACATGRNNCARAAASHVAEADLWPFRQRRHNF